MTVGGCVKQIDQHGDGGNGHGCGGQGGGPLLLDGPAVCGLLSIGLSTLYCMDRSGELGPLGLKLRGRRLWPRRELQAWVDHDCPRRERWLSLWAELRGRVDRG